MEVSAFLNNLVETFQSLGFHHDHHSTVYVQFALNKLQHKNFNGHNRSYKTTSLSLIFSFSTPGYAILSLPATICPHTFQQTFEQHSNENNRQKKSTEHQTRRHPIKIDHTRFVLSTSSDTTHLIAVSSSSLPCKPNGSSSKNTICA